jgi:phage regulator Rha-like protein
MIENSVYLPEVIVNRILVIRGQKVLLGNDLSELYGVEHRVLMQGVKRNIKRFPSDFMFQVTQEEWENLKSQFVTSNWGGIRKMPFAFTEQGVAMLSSVLNSDRAIQVNIQIIRAFTKLRHLVVDNVELRKEIESLRTEPEGKFKIIFETLDHLLAEDVTPKRKIGFTVKDKKAKYSI